MVSNPSRKQGAKHQKDIGEIARHKLPVISSMSNKRDSTVAKEQTPGSQ